MECNNFMFADNYQYYISNETGKFLFVCTVKLKLCLFKVFYVFLVQFHTLQCNGFVLLDHFCLQLPKR